MAFRRQRRSLHTARSHHRRAASLSRRSQRRGHRAEHTRAHSIVVTLLFLISRDGRLSWWESRRAPRVATSRPPLARSAHRRGDWFHDSIHRLCQAGVSARPRHDGGAIRMRTPRERTRQPRDLQALSARRLPRGHR